MATTLDEPGDPGGTHRVRNATRASVALARRHPVQTVACAAFFLQLCGLLAYSGLMYHRFTLGIDFAVYDQAMSEIARGHLNPTLSIFGPQNNNQGYPFIHSHFELMMYPIALLSEVVRTPFLLLVIQDVSVVGVGVVAFFWISAMVTSKNVSRTAANLILLGCLVAILVNPLAYGTVAVDFHLEATATLFAVLLAFDVWSGRTRRAILWAVLCVLCGDLGGLYVAGVGLSALVASRSTRRTGIFLTLGGVIWVGIVSSLGANQGSYVTTEYAYLAGRSVLPTGVSGAALLVGGILAHPGRPISMIHSRLELIKGYLIPGGVIGLFTPWGFGVPLVVLLSSALQSTELFIVQEFQQFAVVPFVLFGTASIVTVLLGSPAAAHAREHGRRLRLRHIAGAAVAVVVFVVALVHADHTTRSSLTMNASGMIIPGNEAAVLRSTLAGIPGDSEVIASVPIMGRFGNRTYVFPYDSVTQNYPLESKKVYLVIDTEHALQLVNPQQIQAAADYLGKKFDARTVVHDAGVWVLELTVPDGVTSTQLP
jgi:pimeloyl-ACP methyl ester carboxylesterase